MRGTPRCRPCRRSSPGSAKAGPATGQVTCFLNNLGLGYQFAAAGYLVHKRAKEAGIGNELPTDWFTETVHP